MESFDEAVDHSFAPLRGKRLPDSLAAAASYLGDRGLIWLLIGLLRARKPGAHRTTALRAVVYTGAVSPVVNAALKTAVGRARPEKRAFHNVFVRVPRTASFPSGHTMAAWCAATLLAEEDPLAPLYYATAAAISVSRVHVRLHHATDVVGGAFIGIALGRLGRRLFRSPGSFPVPGLGPAAPAASRHPAPRRPALPTLRPPDAPTLTVGNVPGDS